MDIDRQSHAHSDQTDGKDGREFFPLAVLTHRYSGYVGIIVLIFDEQSDLDDVIRYHLQFLEKILYMFFFYQKEVF